MKKKVLFVIPSFKRATRTLVSSIASRCSDTHRVHVITFDESTTTFDEEGSIHLYQSDRAGNTFFDKIQLARERSQFIKRFATERHIDTLVGFFKEAAVPVVWSNVWSGIPRKTITGIRNNPLKKFSNGIGYLTASLYRLADRVVTNSKAARNICQEQFGLSNVMSIQNIVDYAEIRRKSRAPVPEKYTELFQKNHVFVNIGRLSPQKGQWHLIRAFKAVVEKKPDTKLLILGEGKLRDRLQQLVEACEIEDHVCLAGFQDNVFPFLKAADCFVLSSLHEGLPNVVLEAKTVGTPVISTDCHTGPREILAPELPLNSTISYPHRSGKHTLVKRLSGDEIWTSPNEHTLEPSEKLLSEVMLNELSRETPVKRFAQDDRFEMDKIIKQWEQIL